MEDKNEAAADVPQSQPMTDQPAVLQPPTFSQPPLLAAPQWNYALPGTVGPTIPPAVGQIVQMQPYAQPVVYYFAQPPPAAGLAPPVTQTSQQQLPATRTDAVNPDDVITDYTPFVCIAGIFCLAAAFPTILFGVPAIYLAVKSRQLKNAGKWKTSQRYSVMSFYFGLGGVILGAVIVVIWVCTLLWFRVFKAIFDKPIGA